VNKLVLTVVLILGILIGGYFLIIRLKDSSKPNPPIKILQPSQKVSFETPKKAAHYESSTPSHGAVLAIPPINIAINFNFDLADASTISITANKKEYGIDKTTVDDNKLTLRRSFDPTAPDGIYTVLYNACWPNGSCHDGKFQFAIDRSKLNDAVDMRNQKVVNIDLSGSTFIPKDIRISQGTQVIWTNSDNVIHYVNTDSHPAHSYFKDQNSKALKKNDVYSLTFNNEGTYPYHCSAHADNMVGTIIVE